MSTDDDRDTGEPPDDQAPSLPAATPALSGRKAIEQELREGEHRLRIVLNSDFLPIMFHSEGVILDANDAAERLLGYSREELMQRDLFDLIVAEDRGRARAYAAAHSQYPYELIWECKDGSLVSLDVEARDILFDDLPSRVVFMRDATERHRAEAEQQNVEAQLRQAQKIEALGQLASGVAHNFNNLLTAIVGYAELLLAKLPEDSDLYADADEIRRAAGRAKEVTRALLVFSRNEPGRRQILDLNEIITGIETLLRQLIPSNIEITIVLAPNLHAVKGDPSQFEQVVVNLAVNARDAMPNGGRLVLETSELNFQESASHAALAPGRYISLSVRDTGTGMDSKTRERIFEPFFTTKGPEQGTGLGLSTVFGVIEEAGGRVLVESVPNQGTTFRIYLPMTNGQRD
jgi:PAS domain S-box-containing protein